MQRLVDSHDKPGVDLLLISAGAPNQHGLACPAEEAIADFLIPHPLGLTRPPDHIQRVILHVRATGQATLLHPDVKPLFSPIYQSLAHVHHPIVQAAQPQPQLPPSEP